MKEALYETLALVGTIDPQAVDGATVLSDAVDMADCEELLTILSLGVIADVVDMKLTQAVTSGGTYKDITGKAITQIAGTGDAGQAMIRLRAPELDVANGYRYVKASVTVGATDAGGLVSVVMLKGKCRNEPASALNLASVAEIVD